MKCQPWAVGQSCALPFCLWTCRNRAHASSVGVPTEPKAAILNCTPFSHLLGTLSPLCLSLSCSLCLEIPSPAQACIQKPLSKRFPWTSCEAESIDPASCTHVPAHLYCSSPHIILTVPPSRGYALYRDGKQLYANCQLWSVSRACLSVLFRADQTNTIVMGNTLI